MFDGLFVCLIAIPMGGVVRLLTIFVARNREKAWRWVAYVVPPIVIVATFIRGSDLGETDPVMTIAMVAIVIGFWSLTGSAFGAILATRLVQGEPSGHSDE